MFSKNIIFGLFIIAFVRTDKLYSSFNFMFAGGRSRMITLTTYISNYTMLVYTKTVNEFSASIHAC